MLWREVVALAVLWIAPACDEARHRVCLQLVPSGWPRLILAAPGGEL